MLPPRLCFVGLQLLTLAYTVHSLVLLSATSEDVKKLARKFVSKSLANKIAEFLELSSGKIRNVSEENNLNMYDNYEDENIFSNRYQFRNSDMGQKLKLFRTTKDLNTPPVRDSEEFEVTEKIKPEKTKTERQKLIKMNKNKKLINSDEGKFNRELRNIDKQGQHVNSEIQSHHRHKLKPDRNEFNNEKTHLYYPHIENERIDENVEYERQIDIKEINQLQPIRKPSQPDTDLLKIKHEQVKPLRTDAADTTNQRPENNYEQDHKSNYEQSYIDNAKKDHVEHFKNVDNVEIEHIPQPTEVSNKQDRIDNFKSDAYSNFNQDQITQFQHDPVYNFRPDDIRHSDLEQDQLNQHISGFKEAHDGNMKLDPSNDLKQHLLNSFNQDLTETNQSPTNATELKLQDTEKLKQQSIVKPKEMQIESLRYNKIKRPLSKRNKEIAAELQRYKELKNHGYPEHQLYVPNKPKILEKEREHNDLEMSFEHTKMHNLRPNVKDILRIDQHYLIRQQKNSKKPNLDKQEKIKAEMAFTDTNDRKSRDETHFGPSKKINTNKDIEEARKIDKHNTNHKNTNNLEPKLDIDENLDTETVAQTKIPAVVATSGDLMLTKDKENEKSWHHTEKETHARPVSKSWWLF